MQVAKINKKDMLLDWCAFIYLIILEFMVAHLSPIFDTTLFYVLIINLALVFAWLAQKSDSKFLMFISFAIAVVPAAFRNLSGIDDEVYLSIMRSVQRLGAWEMFKTTTMEPGYLLLNQLVSLLTSDYLVMQIVSVAIATGGIYVAIYRMRNDISMPAALLLYFPYLYFPFMTAGLIRMAIAVGIVAISLQYLINEEPKKYLVGVFVAALFHYSALSTLFFLFMISKNKNLKVVRAKIISVALTLLPVFMIVLAKFVIPKMGDRYSNYGNMGEFGFSIGSFDMAPVLLLAKWGLSSSEKENNKMYYTLTTLVALACIWSLYNSIIPLGRVAFYCGLGMVFVLALIVKKQMEGAGKKLLLQCIVISYAMFYWWYNSMYIEFNNKQLFPYVSIWGDVGNL